MVLHGGYVYRTANRDFAPLDIWIEGSQIRGIAPHGSFDDRDTEHTDASGCWIVPGLIDVHTHGRVGFDFVSCATEGIEKMTTDYARRGVTTVMPTIETASLEQMLKATEQINRFIPNTGQSNLCGVHWEGRYLNPEKKGAHDVQLLALPDAEELEAPALKACKKLHISLAMELDRNGTFSKAAQAMGATLGLGHTMSTFAEAKEAEGRGIVSYTHLFNAMPTLHHREGGAVCAALTGDRIVELISDGIHICPEMIRLTHQCKGVDGISLVSDSMSAAGCRDGNYKVCGMPVTVKDGIARNDQSGALAGSTLSLDMAVNRFAAFCNIPLTEAIISATATPARQIGIYDSVGSIDIGKQADLLLLKNPERLIPEKILLRGKWLSSKSENVTP